MTTNAILTIKSDIREYNVPVTWIEDFFEEGEELYCDLFLEENYVVDYDDLKLSVFISDNSEIKSQVRWDDMAATVYPAKNIEKLKSAKEV